MSFENHPNLAFWHRGEVGDILYSWYFLSKIGCPVRFTTQPQSNHGTFAQYDSLVRLAALQPYLSSFECAKEQPKFTENLRHWIDGGAQTDGPNIIKPYFKGNAMAWPHYSAWIHGVPRLTVDTEYTVINVTARARDEQHRWGEFLPAGELRFLGLGREYDEFRHHLQHTGYDDAAKRLSFMHTDDFLEAARQIAGAKAFYGNTSACLALAQGLGVPFIYVEADPRNANTSLFGHEVVLNRGRIPWLTSEISANS